MTKRLQNKVAENRYTLTVTVAYTLLVWLAADLSDRRKWIPLVCSLAAGYMMAELNNRNSLIRIYSRMVSASFLLMLTSAVFLFTSLTTGVTAFCCSAFLLIAFQAYQDRHAAGYFFLTFLFVGLNSMFFVHILLFVPFLWFFLGWKVVPVSGKSIFASVLGLVTPYWMISPYVMFAGDYERWIRHFAALGDWTAFLDYGGMTPGRTAVMALVLVTAVTGGVHFLHTSYQDKVRVRMLYEYLLYMGSLCAAFLLVMPCLYDALLPLTVIHAAPLAGHFFALTSTKATNACFIAFLTAVLLITAYNLWMPLFNF